MVTMITGASGGIGADLARQCAGHHHHLILIARSEQNLLRLADEILALGAPQPLIIAVDLQSPSALDMIEQKVRGANLRITGLINNAGYGLTGPITDSDQDDQIGIIDLNIRALVALTLRFLPDLQHSKGRILNVASVASFMPGPFMAVYYASKAFVLSFSRALREELSPAGISVSALCPGLTATDFQRRAGMDPAFAGLMSMSSKNVARIGFEGWMQQKAVIIPGLLNHIFIACAWLLPSPLLLWMMAKIQINRRQKA
jgi:short-subunit dehydrogenase